MEQFASLFGIVELTHERERHILAFHPEVGAVRAFFPEAIASPDETRTSAYDESVAIHYKWVNDKFLAIVIKKSPQRNFVLTAYLTKRIQHTTL